MFPAIESTYIAEGGWYHSFERICLAIAEIGSFDMGWLDLAAVVYNRACWVDEGLLYESDRVSLVDERSVILT